MFPVKNTVNLCNFLNQTTLKLKVYLNTYCKLLTLILMCLPTYIAFCFLLDTFASQSPILTALPLKTEVTSKMPRDLKSQYSYYNCIL